ncbi:hypothetical protein U1Q18_011140 [Sarracenia purpurea var. burkii]
MKPTTKGVPRTQGSKSFQGGVPNWILIAGSALLSTISIRLGYKLKQVLDAKQPETSYNGNGKTAGREESGSCLLHSNGYCFSHDEGGRVDYIAGTQGMVEIKQQSDGQLVTEPNAPLPLVAVPATGFNRENSIIWASSPDHLELPQKPFHQSNSSDSPCVSESGSDIFSKREVIQKLRQQLKRRDDMIMEMQDQIGELKNSLSSQLTHSSDLQSLLDSANRDLLDSEREIQRLRKAIADCYVGQVDLDDKSSTVPMRPSTKRRNGHTNGYFGKIESSLECSGKERGDWERVEMLKREVVELKEVIKEKEYLLQSYKEQKAELSMKVMELQQRMDFQLPSIL